jgi:hypothetical protein
VGNLVGYEVVWKFVSFVLLPCLSSTIAAKRCTAQPVKQLQCSDDKQRLGNHDLATLIRCVIASFLPSLPTMQQHQQLFSLPINDVGLPTYRVSNPPHRHRRKKPSTVMEIPTLAPAPAATDCFMWEEKKKKEDWLKMGAKCQTSSIGATKALSTWDICCCCHAAWDGIHPILAQILTCSDTFNYVMLKCLDISELFRYILTWKASCLNI